MNNLELPGRSLNSFILTQEFNRFQEFASACMEFRYIGICHGEPGVGKSLAAMHFTQWREELVHENAVDKLSLKKKKVIKNCKGAVVTAPVTNTPKIIKTEITYRTFGYGLTLAKANGETDLCKMVNDALNACPLVIIDEADRLNINALEEVRSLYDRHQFGLILIGIRELKSGFPRYPQLYSRIDFSHEFKRLSADEMRFVFPKYGPVWD